MIINDDEQLEALSVKRDQRNRQLQDKHYQKQWSARCTNLLRAREYFQQEQLRVKQREVSRLKLEVKSVGKQFQSIKKNYDNMLAQAEINIREQQRLNYELQNLLEENASNHENSTSEKEKEKISLDQGESLEADYGGSASTSDGQVEGIVQQTGSERSLTTY